MTNAEIASDKKDLRKQILAARAESAEGHFCEDQHDEHIVLHLADQGYRKIAAYVAMEDEPCTDLLLGVCEEVGIQVLVPRVAGDELEWVLFDWDDLEEGEFGVPEPIGDAEPLQVEALIIPALAVDQHGNRLGRGKGYYDRVLAGLPASVQVIALVHDSEFLEDVPTEDFDRRVTHVATCSGLYPVA
jgi:5-formyltetrahydrofolate cyclo-ligase